ncbi:exodeoxyribonuclease VII small subunit [Prevotella dentasini]|uniref:exodeoxyribonuclease VII small subunit n=1 Tax=Prevotella dentasini TaxID=589537 RepID=UPI00046A3431|nr:exodeoxyribonuclease VII small subunit [Prevotella dentasini]
MNKKDMKYEEAIAQLEAIVTRMENGELDLDEMAGQLKQAQMLVRMCRDRLKKTDMEIKKLLKAK